MSDQNNGRGANGECLCDLCTKLSPLVEKIRPLITEEENKTLDYYLSQMEMDSTDAVFWKEKFYGTWPGTTVEDIQHHIKKLEERIKQIQKEQ